MLRRNSKALNRSPKSRGWKARLLGALVLLAWAYPITLLCFACALTFVGERYWVTAALLYVPRLVFAVPLPVLVLLLYWSGLRRLLWSQYIAAALVLIPLMGFVPPWPNRGSTERTLRVLSFNVDSGYAGEPRLVEVITAQHPDVAVLVEAPLGHDRLRNALAAHYPYVNRSSQFLVASRFPITLTTELPSVHYSGRSRASRAMRYELATPGGPIVLYAVHPISPRGAFGLYRYRGIFSRLRQPERVSISNDEESDMLGNAGLRSVQIETVARRARAEHLPVLIAGDTNLPGLSALLRRAFAGYQDGFASAGWGFGYTFPAKHPFLRLDRILAGPQFRFTSFQSGCPGASDHLCVWADLARR